MQLSNLNKIGALFIAGSIAVLWSFAFWLDEIAFFVATYKGLANPLTAALGAFLLFPLSVLAGLVLEGLAELTLRPFVGRALSSHSMAKFFRQGGVWNSTTGWEKAFLEIAPKRPFFSSALNGPAPRVTSRSVAAGIFYQNATKDQVDWLLSHYATYYLATSFGLTLILFMLIPFKLVFNEVWSTSNLLLALGFLAAALYAALSLAIDRFLYTYLATFRFAALWLEKEASDEGVERQAEERITPASTGLPASPSAR